MIDRDIKTFILRALLAANGAPMTDDTLKGAVTAAFQHVALTAHDLNRHIKSIEASGWIAGTHDELLGVVWALTPGGKIKALQL